MFDRRKLVARAVGIMLMIAASGFALADNATNYRSELRDDLDLANGAEITATNRAGIPARADADSDDGYVIEEIVVIGRKKSRKSYLGSSADTYPVMQLPSWIDWQFLPRYDPAQADRYFDLIQPDRYFDLIPLDEEIRRAGFIELFRLSFGR